MFPTKLLERASSTAPGDVVALKITPVQRYTRQFKEILGELRLRIAAFTVILVEIQDLMRRLRHRGQRQQKQRKQREQPLHFLASPMRTAATFGAK